MRARYFKFGGKLVYKAWWHISSVFCDVFGRIELCGYENVPKSPCIIVANHVSYLDPMAMAFSTRPSFARSRATPSCAAGFSGGFSGA